MSVAMTVHETAPAKINLALHVTGQRSDGYHLIETLVTFAGDGDVIEARPAETDGFSMSGRFATGLTQVAGGSDGNLVLKARDGLRAALRDAGFEAPPVHLHLEKNLPIASGIGGGSADAAATIRALLRLWQAEPSAGSIEALAVRLGADVPMCLSGRPLMASGIGEDITPATALPSFVLILGNPLQPVSTPQVFRALTKKDNAPIGPLPASGDDRQWIDWIATLRNDLEPPARQLASGISELSDLLAETGARLVRMSGSGATCFGIYANRAEAEAAFTALQAARPEWYFMLTETTPGGDGHGRN